MGRILATTERGVERLVGPRLDLESLAGVMGLGQSADLARMSSDPGNGLGAQHYGWIRDNTLRTNLGIQ